MSRRIDVKDEELQALLQRPLKDTTPEQLTGLFAGGAKRLQDWLLGLEIEVFPHRSGTRESAGYEALVPVLERVRDHLGFEGEHEKDGHLVGLKGDGQIVSLEPGGQIEYATRPYRALRDLRRAVTEFAGVLSQAARAEGLELWALGHHPFDDRDTIPKMPKARYDLMRAYLGGRGERALDMMHLTGSVQCAVDFSDERNMVDKVRTAARISPFLSALTAASPFFRGEANGFRSMRYEIWLHTDNTRCGLWPEMFDDEGLTFRRYVEHALHTPAMFFLRDDEYHVADALPFTTYAENGFNDTTVTVVDFVDHLTSLFPEIRPKSYIELRGADCAPPVEAVAIAGFWRGILDDEDTRLEADDRLSKIDYAAAATLQPEVARKGLEAESPAGQVADVVRWLVERSHARLAKSAPDCAECLMPLVERAQRRESLADELLRLAEADGIDAALNQVKIA